MRLVFLGPPGSGKGTQAQILAERHGIPHISTGDIFRENIRDSTELGLEAKKFSDQGMLVPDEVTNAMVEKRLLEPDCIRGFILDGYPRTVNQADFLAKVRKPDIVMNFTLEDKEVIKRISGRRTCTRCGAVYHVDYKPPREKGVCDSCGESLVQREDEAPAVVKKRLSVYKTQTRPLVEYYQQKGNLVSIDASPPIQDISRKIQNELGRYFKE